MPPMFKVSTLSKTELPQTLIFLALHQDYSPHPVIEQYIPPEDECVDILSVLKNGDSRIYRHFPLGETSFIELRVVPSNPSTTPDEVTTTASLFRSS